MARAFLKSAFTFVCATALSVVTATTVAAAPSPGSTSVHPSFPGDSALRNKATGACVDDSRLGLRAFPCNGTNFQHWFEYAVEDPNRYTFTNSETQNCLDDSSLGLRALRCNDTNYQKWSMYLVGPGRQIVLRNVATGGCLDDSSYGLRTFECNNTDFQVWSV